MRKFIAVCFAGLLTATAYADLQNVEADLQNVEIGGEVRVRGRYWNNVYSNGIGGPAQIRIPGFYVPGRSIGPLGVTSRYDFDDSGENLDFYEMRTRINFTADFSDEVKAFIELESYDVWGTDFRSGYITGADAPGVTVNDLEVYQSYIEANSMYGHPLRLRVGRQEMKMGKGWLVDDIAAAVFGRSFDAIRLTYDTDAFVVDAWASKLAETFNTEEDGDIDFYGVYATYKALEPIDLSLYWMLIRDSAALSDTNYIAPVEWIEDAIGIDDYDPTYINTIGLRANGSTGAWDYDLELAYQFGDADSVGFGFKPFGVYGDDGADFDVMAADIEVGYSFDTTWSPRVYLGAAYFEGEDNRDLSFAEWLNPFDMPEASLSFNRLFPGKPYSGVLEIGQDMSNFYQFRGGVNFNPTESVSGKLQLAYFGVDEPFDLPRSISLGRYRVPLAPSLSFWTQEADNEIGWQASLSMRYHYSADLSFGFHWDHLFVGDGLVDGSFLHRNGLEFSGGTDDDDAHYIHVDAVVRF
jgi:hypothetical protein